MKLSKYWTTVTPFSFTLAAILFLSLPIVGFFMGLNYKTSTTALIQQVQTRILPLTNSDTTKTDNLYYINPNLAFMVPDGSKIETGYVTIYKIKYQVYSGSPMGACPANSYGKTCNYTDESLPNVRTLRIWKDSSGIFLINPQGVSVNGYTLNNFKITKASPNHTFTNNEVALWKGILANWKSFDIYNK